MKRQLTRRMILGGAVLGAGGVGAAVLNARRTAGYDAALARMHQPLGADHAALVRYATLAANGHNTQPWRFVSQDGAIDVLPDFTRSTPVVDPDDHHLFASLGCAVENLVIAARAQGMAGDVAFDGGRMVVDLTPGTVERQRLIAAIPERQSTRGMYDGTALTTQEAARLIIAAQQHETQAIFISEPGPVAKLTDLVVAGNSDQIADPAFVRELRDWLRFNPVEAADKGDGLFSGSTGNPSLPSWAGRAAFPFVFTAKAENQKIVEQVASSAGFIILVGPSDNPAGWVAAGRACQRVMLQATIDGLKCAFLNQPVEVPSLREQVQAEFGLGAARPDLILRVGRGPATPRSLRRPVSAVLT
ncbi:Acg family FMN-binding oxidoreductase [Actibacterium lipolyticum]|uniref:Putative NAD(P)H nitroreductase/MT3217 n=1 Tax=Actibacterium lipolyticum TaxID=1524263 RepID=A0A238KU88_9RHOB|nr:Tat pathway signal protein [Actibacterium lipolyticum]SMX46355.1 Putative NAD(P)H nitroreductase/MT3217 [Actibacterium lipolyticum]